MSDGQATGPRILVVEDDFYQTLELERVLYQHGFAVAGAASTVGSAVDEVRRCQPALAIVDLKLCGESAEPVLLELEAVRVPYVVVTGYGEGKDLWRKHPPVLSKPIERDDLILAIQLVLWRSSADRRPPRHARRQTPRLAS